MESKFVTKCVYGHEVYKMCTKKSCSLPAGICRVEECDYSKVHRKCLTSCQMNDIVEHLMDFAKQRSQETDQIVIGTINRMMKVLETLKNEYLSKSGSLEDQLRGNRKELYQLMKNGPANNIKSQLVIDVLEGSNGEEKESESIKRLREIAERVEKMQKEGLHEMRKWIEPGEKVQFVFDKELSKQDILEITDKGKNLKRISPKWDSLSLISPSIYKAGNQKITLSLTNYQSSYLILGLGRKEKLVESNFKFPRNQQGIFMIRGNGKILNHSNIQQHQKLSEFRFDKGDTIDLEYKQLSQCLTVTNLTKKTTVTLLNVTNQDKDLHYCVYTWYKGDEWAIIE